MVGVSVDRAGGAGGGVSERSESELVEEAKHDSAAFGLLYERYVDRIYQYIYSRVGNRTEAEDLTSGVFMRVRKALPRYVDRGAPFASWLYRIAHNLVANFHRDQGRRATIPIDLLPLTSRPDDAPEEVAELRDALRMLRRVVATLQEDRRELLRLKHIEGLSNAQIGQMMGRTEGAIKSLYHRTLVALREELARRGFG